LKAEKNRNLPSVIDSIWLEIRSPGLRLKNSGDNHLNAQKFIFLRPTHLLLN